MTGQVVMGKGRGRCHRFFNGGIGCVRSREGEKQKGSESELSL